MKKLGYFDVFSLVIGSIIGWGSFTLPGKQFLSQSGIVNTTLGLFVGGAKQELPLNNLSPATAPSEIATKNTQPEIEKLGNEEYSAPILHPLASREPNPINNPPNPNNIAFLELNCRFNLNLPAIRKAKNAPTTIPMSKITPASAKIPFEITL